MRDGLPKGRSLDYFSAIDHDQEAIIVRVRGLVASYDLADLERKYRKLALEKGYVLVMDCYQAHLNFDITQLYLWFKQFYDEEIAEDKRLLEARIIFLIPQGNYEAEKINIAWSSTFMNSIALTKPLSAVQEYIASRPYGFWQTA